MISEALKAADTIKGAAELLGIPVSTLRYRMRKHGLSRQVKP